MVRTVIHDPKQNNTKALRSGEIMVKDRDEVPPKRLSVG